jgi:AraC-like DNA-binding protein
MARPPQGLKILARLPWSGRYAGGMRSKARLVSGHGFALDEVRCADEAPSGWSAPEPSGGYGLVLVRSGLFRRRVDGAEAVLDPAGGYWERPGDHQQVAHPVAEGDTCTLITLSAELLASLGGGEPSLPGSPVLTTDGLDLAHRRLVARARAGGGPRELGERVVRLAAGALAQRLPERVAAGRPATAAARRRLVADAREALAAGPGPDGLLELARLLGASPYHLSRVFHGETGMTLSGFRNRLRTRRALERLAAGEPDLARLAADLGFADHAHLTRTMREQLGHTPTELRRLLATAP